MRVAKASVPAGVSLRLMHSFSLRFKESVMFRPHQDVLTSAQAARIAGRAAHHDLDPGQLHLLVRRGTKGGRPRLFPVDTPPADRRDRAGPPACTPRGRQHR